MIYSGGCTQVMECSSTRASRHSVLTYLRHTFLSFLIVKWILIVTYRYKGFFYAFIPNVMRISSFLWILAQYKWLNYHWILITTEITKPTSIIPFSVEAPVTVTASPSSSPTRILELKVSNFYQSLYPIACIRPSSLLRYFFFCLKSACILVILTIWFGCLKFELNIIINIITTIIDFVFCHFWRKAILFLIIFPWKAGFFEHHKRQEENSSFDRRKSVWISRRKTIYILLGTQSFTLYTC